ncbi:hypothetical protein ABIA00_004368 [Bradyrhizobium ottawaense]
MRFRNVGSTAPLCILHQIPKLLSVPFVSNLSGSNVHMPPFKFELVTENALNVGDDSDSTGVLRAANAEDSVRLFSDTQRPRGKRHNRVCQRDTTAALRAKSAYQSPPVFLDLACELRK